jgi:hypothetical protein
VAQAVCPPVNAERYRLGSASKGFFDSISRCTHYKHLSLIVETYIRIGRPLVVIATDETVESV